MFANNLQKVSGLPVVNAEGVLVGNISASDLKVIAIFNSIYLYQLVGFNHEFVGLITAPIKEYLNQLKAFKDTVPIRSSNATSQEEEKPHWVAKCKVTDTLGSIVKQVNFYSVHRVYCVDKNGKPVRVISLTDILKALLDL